MSIESTANHGWRGLPKAPADLSDVSTLFIAGEQYNMLDRRVGVASTLCIASSKRTGNPTVAIKIANIPEKEEVLYAFKREAGLQLLAETALSVVQQVKVPTIHHVGFIQLPTGNRDERAEYPAIVMDYASGVPLILNGERKDREIVRKFAAAVDVLGLVHGDLKPDNVLLLAGNFLTFIDFETLVPPGDTGAAAIGEDGTQAPILTPGYAPPEQLRVNAPLTLQTNTAQLGATVFSARHKRHLLSVDPYRGVNPVSYTDDREAALRGLPIHEQDAYLNATAYAQEERPTATGFAELLYRGTPTTSYPTLSLSG